MAITAQAERRDGVLAHRHDRGEREGLRRSPQGQHEGCLLPQDDGRRPQGRALVAQYVMPDTVPASPFKFETQTRLSLRFFVCKCKTIKSVKFQFILFDFLFFIPQSFISKQPFS